MKHDVIAFLTHLTEIVGPEARFVHQGLTSSDVLDTCLNVQLVRAADLLLADVDSFWRRCSAAPSSTRYGHHRPQPRHPRRTDHLRPQARHLLRRIVRARRRRLTPRARRSPPAPISGAVGTFANVDPRVEEYVAEAWASARAGLHPGHPARPPRRCTSPRWAWSPPRSSIWRSRSATCSAPRCCEAEEYFSPGQKGSSAMPHKRNPILTENLTGLARLVRAYGAAGAGERGALARARHLPLVGRAHDRPGRHHRARLRAGRAGRRDRQAAWSIPSA